MSYDRVLYQDVTWIDIIQPDKQDIKRLHEEFPQFHPLALEDCLSLLERPKLDEFDDHLFMVMQFPLWDASQRITRPAEVDLFVGESFLVTVHGGELPPLRRLRHLLEENPKQREKIMGPGATPLMHTIIDKLVDYLFPIISKIDANIHSIEEDIFSEDTRQIVQEISIVRRDLIVLRRIVRPQVAILSNLENKERSYMEEDLDDYFGDILDHITKVRDIIDENYEVVVSLADTADTLASHRINEVMRILTVISVIMLPLTLITGIFGMNVPLPFQNKAASLIGVLGLMFLISVAMLVYFRHRKWL